MDHKAFISTLSHEQRRELTSKSNVHGLIRLGLHWGAIALLGSLIWHRVPLWPLLLVPQGILIVFLFTLLHESIHRTPFSSTWLNQVVGRVCSFAVLLPANWFRYFHLAHHRHTQDPALDPELLSGEPATLRTYVLTVSGLPVWWSHLKTLFRNAFGGCDDQFVPANRLPRVRREAIGMLLTIIAVLALAIVMEWKEVVWVWFVPALLGQPFLRLYLMAEHGGCPFVSDMFANTRTILANHIVRAVAWNMPYHAEHHAMPGIPFHKLPQFHEMVRPHLQVIESSYSTFHARKISNLPW